MARPHNGQSVCQSCGGNTLEHKHSLTSGLVGALIKFHQKAGTQSVNLKEVGLTRNQWDNFQKLKYWNLVVQEGKGVWRTSTRGQQFLRGETVCYRSVWTYRGAPVEYAGEQLTIDQLGGSDTHYLRREDYSRA